MNAIQGLLSTQPELLLAIDKPTYTKEKLDIKQSSIIKGPSSEYNVHLKGKIVIRVKHGKQLQHNGIDIQFVNAIENDFDKSCNLILNSVGMQLEPTNPLDNNHKPIVGGSVIPFEFILPITYDSYVGGRVKILYYIECTIKKTLNNTIAKEFVNIQPDFFLKPIPPTRPIHLEVGIEDVLHLELSCRNSTFNLNGSIVGILSFILVRIKIKTIELQILRKEAVGSFSTTNAFDQQIVASYQVVDGPVSKGDTVPIRCFLAALDLSPSFKDVEKRISIRYFLNLVLVDEENRRYFKQQEIDLYREIPGKETIVMPSPSPLLLPDTPTSDILSSPKSSRQEPLVVESEQGSSEVVPKSDINEEPQVVESPKQFPESNQTIHDSSSSNTDHEENADPLFQSHSVWQ
eukprot:NODE_67_length_25542_cov_1.476831.p6 type:complete len:404 gc:universal NODE_67_length_25542_cov_1.476831:21081-22292(+)